MLYDTNRCSLKNAAVAETAVVLSLHMEDLVVLVADVLKLSKKENVNR